MIYINVNFFFIILKYDKYMGSNTEYMPWTTVTNRYEKWNNEATTFALAKLEEW